MQMDDAGMHSHCHEMGLQCVEKYLSLKNLSNGHHADFNLHLRFNKVKLVQSRQTEICKVAGKIIIIFFYNLKKIILGSILHFFFN